MVKRSVPIGSKSYIGWPGINAVIILSPFTAIFISVPPRSYEPTYTCRLSLPTLIREGFLTNSMSFSVSNLDVRLDNSPASFVYNKAIKNIINRMTKPDISNADPGKK